MGSYTFKWEHPASEVYVTGTFDDWSKSVKLAKKNGVFEKTVDLPKSNEDILYKFVVDGEWTTNHAAPTEPDASGNLNNVLKPSDIKSAPVPQTISSVGPGATTATMAGQVPKEGGKKDTALPGTFPETPAEQGTEPQFSVNPIPATAGAGNPVQLKPGEKVPDPSTLTSNTVQSTVKDGPAAMDKPDAAVASGSLGKKSDDTSGIFGVPPVTSTMIPESSLPMGDGTAKETTNAGPTITSVDGNSTTAALAGQVPKEPRGVPEIVTESQKKAKVDPEASASPAAVADKKEVESELTKKVPEEAPAADSDKTSGGIIAGAAAGAAAGVTALAGAAYAAQAKAAQAVGLGSSPEPTSNVPEPVTESIEKANASPEAAASPKAVDEKSKVEQELLKEVKTTTESGEPAPSLTAATTDKAPATSTTNSTTPAAAAATKSAEDTTLAVPPAAKETKLDSRDVSPLSGPRVPDNSNKPTVTTGVETSTTEPKTEAKAKGDTPSTPGKSSAAAAKNGEASTTTATTAKNGEAAKTTSTPDSAKEKKKKRMSGFFGKLKEKFK